MNMPVKFLRNFAKQLGVNYKMAKSEAERSQSRKKLTDAQIEHVVALVESDPSPTLQR